jgi:hypothetical protein
MVFFPNVCFFKSRFQIKSLFSLSYCRGEVSIFGLRCTMKKKYLQLILLSILLFVLLMFMQSCSDNSLQPSGDYISGWVTFSDTNFLKGGYYAISMYENKSNPFSSMPLESDSLPMKKYRNGRMVYYRFTYEGSGSYYFGVTWIQIPLNPNVRPPVLATLGCDTNINCNDHEIIMFPNFTGANYNIFSWTDTTKRLY